MSWIVIAAIVNTIWTFYCARMLPPRVATHFGLGGQPDGWMSRRGFTAFAIVFPLVLAGFIVWTGSLGGKQSASINLPTSMQHLAAGTILFFSAISWTLVRSNRRSPARVDRLGLAVSLVILFAFMSVSLGGIIH